MTSKKPFATTKLTAFLQKRILELKPRKSQADIAAEAGFVQMNMLSMIKTGTSPLPIDRVPGLARALEVDPRRLAQLALEQRFGEMATRALMEIFGTIVTRNELEWLREIRDSSGNIDPSLTSRARSAIRAIFGK